jgi:hypothetical protein
MVETTSLTLETQNLQSTNAIPPELDRIVQNDVTPEQFAKNALNLEIYSRMNAIALGTYLQSQSEQAEKCMQHHVLSYPCINFAASPAL